MRHYLNNYPYLKIKSNEGKTILIINGAGGVGSVATQLASNAGLTVIATASRPKSINWVKSHGAADVVNHRKNLVNEVHKLGYKYIDYILELKDIDSHWKEMCELIKPEGAIASITENRRPINLRLLTPKKGYICLGMDVHKILLPYTRYAITA